MFATGEAAGVDFADWAVEALGAGLDSPSLRRLAALSGERPRELSLTDTQPLFEASARELGLRIPTREEALLSRLDGHALGAQNIDELLAEIHWRIVAPLDHQDTVAEWCYIGERLASGRAEELTDDEIRAFAREWLEKRKGSSP